MGNDTPAGWYPAPDSSDLVRYWDGEMWTEQARPAPRGRGGPNRAVTGNPTLPVQTSEVVAAALQPDEQIEAGFHTGGNRKFFVASDIRVLIIQKEGRRFRSKEYVTYSIGYDEIETIGLNKWGTFEMTCGGQKFYSGSQHTGDFLSFVRSRMVRSGPLDLDAMPPPEAAVTTPPKMATAAAPAQAPAPSAEAAADEDDSMTDELERVIRMFSDGFLTDAEFALAKAKLLED